ncbi:MAG: ribonuclease P protein component [Bacteroidetes bacterium]|nr:ribonuclease P protein component [Bacteroidota bacterium]
MGDTLRNTLTKQERLTNVKLIENLYKINESAKAFPLILVYNYHTIENITQVMFSVSKKKFKRAVDRNKIKRLMKECYRLQKHHFYSALEGKTIYGSLMYTGSEIPSYELIFKTFEKLIAKLNEKNG